jgi:MFS family permease
LEVQDSHNIPKWILPVIVISQFCCTSLWFAGNAVMSDLVANFNLNPGSLAHITSSVQFGFIAGTLLFAFLSLADRFSPSRLFFLSALAAAIFNLAIVIPENNFFSILIFRFLTGFFLAGVYPVGMKIAADYYQRGLGKSLGYLVGALVVGTALPHFLKGMTLSMSWTFVISLTSILAFFGGLILWLLVPDGPHRKSSPSIDLRASIRIFRNTEFRSAALGYFGHMWELYAFWAFIPIMLSTYSSIYPGLNIDIPFWSFLIIGIGGPACVLAGYLSKFWGEKKIAALALFLSGICCLLSPLIFFLELTFIFLAFLFFWGAVVVADSPLFSTLVANNVESHLKGTALTVVNCLGFSITILSIQLINILTEFMDAKYLYLVLAIGPLLGLLALFPKKDLAFESIQSEKI